MSCLALVRPGSEPYRVEFPESLPPVLLRIDSNDLAEIRRRLHEIAEVAGHGGGLGFVLFEGLGSTLRLEIAGHVVSYLVDDAKRTLTVLSIVSTEPG
jgi:mRNA-degrading endonuclease RelE of RelBE toxin-antitoxin system